MADHKSLQSIFLEPYITWGMPNLKSVRELVYKRGFVKVEQSSKFKSVNMNSEKPCKLVGIWAEVCQLLILSCWRISCPRMNLSISYIAHAIIGVMSGNSLIHTQNFYYTDL